MGMACRNGKPYCGFTYMKIYKDMWFIVFFVLPFAGLAYTLWHVWCVLPFAFAWKCAVVAACVVAFSALFLNFSHAIDAMPMWLARACYETGNSAIFVMLYAVLAFLLLDVGRLVRVVPRAWLYHNGTTAAVMAVLLVAVFTYGYANYMDKRRHAVDLPTAKAVGGGGKMVLVSDLHLGYHNGRKELARWVNMVNAERPDVVLIAGDIVDGSFRPLREEGMASEMRRIEAPVYAVFGNHEYYSGADEAVRFYREAGITLLRDSVATVGGMAIVGRDDRSNPHRKSLGALMRGVDRTKYVVLLDHQPYHLEQAERAGVDFQFSGHTHHGQLWPISWITEAVYEDAYGPWQRGLTRYYVSSGMGIWGAKFRVGTCSEYVVATVRQGS